MFHVHSSNKYLWIRLACVVNVHFRHFSDLRWWHVLAGENPDTNLTHYLLAEPVAPQTTTSRIFHCEIK